MRAGAVEVIDVHLLNLGWDLEFVFADGSTQARITLQDAIENSPSITMTNLATGVEPTKEIARTSG